MLLKIKLNFLLPVVCRDNDMPHYAKKCKKLISTLKLSSALKIALLYLTLKLSEYLHEQKSNFPSLLSYPAL